MDAFINRAEPGDEREVIGRIGPDATGAGRVLVVSGHRAWAGKVRRVALEIGASCDVVETIEAARRMLDEPLESGRASESMELPFDVVIVDVALADGDGFEIVERALKTKSSVILAGKRVNLDLAACALVCGATDVVERSAISGRDLKARVLAGIERSRNMRRKRSGGPRRLCGLTNGVEGADTLDNQNLDSEVSDLLLDYLEHAERMNNVTTASEFKGLIRAELDIEQLLRTTLEFVLARSGPTNAAVFLPTTSGDYSLGAYVNYDCPKETCDVLLDHLANAVAPRFEGVNGLVHLNNQSEMDHYIGEDADWLQGSGVVGFPCIAGGECLAIVMLFRDKRSPFQAALLEQLKTVGELFAAQLARVIHIHHRHLPKDKWSMLGDPPSETDDYDDLAA